MTVTGRTTATGGRAGTAGPREGRKKGGDTPKEGPVRSTAGISNMVVNIAARGNSR